MTEPPNRLARPAGIVIAAVYLVCAGACLSAARSSLLQLSRPSELYLLSALAAGAVGILFVAAIVGCLIRPSRFGLFPPWCSMAAIPALALLIVALSGLAIVRQTGTSFVSWEQWRGLPLAWLEISHYYGPCPALGQPCRLYAFLSLRPWALLLDLGTAAAVAVHIKRLASRRH